MKMKRLLSVLLTAALVSAMFAPVGSAEETEDLTEAAAPAAEDETDDADESSSGSSYFSGEIDAIVPWGAGGGTDTLMRSLALIASPALDADIKVENMAGNTGATGLEYVADQPSDGSTILMSAENPALYETLGISDLSYDDFTCVLLVGDETVGVIVGPDSTYETMTDLVNAALSGTTVTMASTGKGGVPWEVTAMLETITGATFEEVEYDGDASANQAVQDGECDFTISKIGTIVDDNDAGVVNCICVIADEPIDPMPDVPVITDEYPEFATYLPWGPFSGVFVKNDTDASVVENLSEGFQQAYADDEYQTVLANNYVNPLGLSGDDAADYISNWAQSTLSAIGTEEEEQTEIPAEDLTEAADEEETEAAPEEETEAVTD